MNQSLRHASKPHDEIGFLSEELQLRALRLEKVYGLRLEYASYTLMGPDFACPGRTSIPGVLYYLLPACPTSQAA
jgi:hypothetical protein